MRDQDRLRIGTERMIRATMGAQTTVNKGTEANARALGLEAMISALPIRLDDLSELQSYTTGVAWFMWGYSAFGGDDPFG